MHDDPRLRGIKFLLDDAAAAMNWLSRHTVGSDLAPSVRPHVTGLTDIADHLDAKFGNVVVNSLVSGIAIDRGVDVVFIAIARNPALAARLAPHKGLFKDFLKAGFQMMYRGRSFGDAVTDRALSKYAGMQLPPGMDPVFKSALGAMFAESLRAHHLEQ